MCNYVTTKNIRRLINFFLFLSHTHYREKSSSLIIYRGKIFSLLYTCKIKVVTVVTVVTVASERHFSLSQVVTQVVTRNYLVVAQVVTRDYIFL